ncbi:conserved hypothetical protein [Pseudomonas sp. 8Z]|uniref:hypothetical protein n=1 Tax=Pseudomonas sp. 8Z TaxID=2653166 RepID=UPI0012F2C27E|nr:hypothetical protein [Pseudomonas sp. 8Z]VXC98460.1 conserved hypothetical protein [Pseudomonas sp. 8Z]
MQISPSAFSSGLSGIQSGQRRVDQAAFDIAGSGLPQAQQTNQSNLNTAQNQVNPTPQNADANSPDLTESLVALRVGENEVRANARVVDTADEVLGTLIDTRA